MPEPIIVADIEPERIARWKRRDPIHYQDLVHDLDNLAIIERGGASHEFIRNCCDHAVQTLVCMYEAACPTNKQRLRRRFRLLLAEYPRIEVLWPVLRWRLNEHDRWVQFGMEELDEDEVEGRG
jgi:hypothetical protein